MFGRMLQRYAFDPGIGLSPMSLPYNLSEIINWISMFQIFDAHRIVMNRKVDTGGFSPSNLLIQNIPSGRFVFIHSITALSF